MRKETLTFGEWLPDQPSLQKDTLIVAENCFPVSRGYQAFKTQVPYSTALPATALGAFLARDQSTNEPYVFAGTTERIYRMSGIEWITAGAGYAETVAWEFVKFGDNVLAVNGGHTAGAKVQLAPLGTLLFADANTNAPAAGHIAVVRDFVVVGDTFDAIDGRRPERVRWAGIDSASAWTVSVATQADYQDLRGGGGQVQKIVGGEYGLVLQKHSIHRMTYVGSPNVFQLDEVLSSHLGPTGTPAGNSAVRVGDVVYLLLNTGFAKIEAGSRVSPIGAERVDRWFNELVDSEHLGAVRGFAHPDRNVVMWTFRSNNATSGRADMALIYDYVVDMFSSAKLEVDLLLVGAITGLTLEQLDTINASIDALPESLDSGLWAGSPLNSFAAIDSQHRLSFFSGDAATARILTGEVSLNAEGRAMTRHVRPIGISKHASSTMLRVLSRKRQNEAHRRGAYKSINRSGRIPARVDSRYHSFEMLNSDLTTHTLQGLVVSWAPTADR